ncbi:MAG: DNA repair protein RecN [Parvibaculaceae bacterium]
MLVALSVRDLVLIDRLDMEPAAGLTVLTGETGAGKSVLLDALGLALGARGDASLVRHGTEKAVVTASFALAPGHAAWELLEANDIAAEDELVIRRIQSPSGTSRAFVNDQPVSVALLRQLGSLLVEIHGQHDERALVEAANHRRLLDAFASLEAEVVKIGELWRAASEIRAELDEERRKASEAAAERSYIEHAVEELRALAPVAGEEESLAAKRQLMMNAEGYAKAISEARDALGLGQGFEGRLSTALRKLERRREGAGGRLDEAAAALERVAVEVAEADRQLSEAERAFAFDPRELEEAEERLFALRAQARKHNVLPDALAGLRETLEAQLRSIEDSGRRIGALEAEAGEAAAAYDAAAEKLSKARRKHARALGQAVLAELPPLKLERARFDVLIESDPAIAGPQGIDRVEFLVAANPGTPLAALAKVASGGELSRFMLALKVVLAAKGSAPTLIFDEIDTGVGGAVADAMGERLHRLARDLQVLTVTHSPQVAGRAGSHFLLSKIAEVGAGSERVVTRLSMLGSDSRREEIARMLSGARVTEEARAQADQLLRRTA